MVKGLGTYTGQVGAPVVQVTIPRRRVDQPSGAVTAQFLRVGGQPGASYLCPYISAYFRAIQWEQDSVVDKIPFLSYNTGSLPQPPGRPALLRQFVSAVPAVSLGYEGARGENRLRNAARS